ncbi:hypothetical protein [Streptomyces sp. TRM70350]|uniref:hypothetical protein n=1 Tax=Streptomyces sp. TRM70350 TaxID=2856165 RepID=UPI001C4780A2|nr:hypothetical protein [Streptomyces sp. TRM70350]MBV7700679.1 hypothetical protein [Streptomyces sp. TRM70350]
MGHRFDRTCSCKGCGRKAKAAGLTHFSERGGWSVPMGGGDADGNEITVSFGEGRREGETLIGDGDRSEMNFLDSDNHDHYGSGHGPNDNGTDRGQYSGPGH